ncbi:hypothetical protein ANABIO32_11600 [Rossellomorea marisflavi]|uniref:hypothetical protein n=1 Tax=Rossellomorea marisflavi TaxID=189381 RepID=UPI0025C9C101|nr:hypothetical protein [Rossellomorea marisflavi]GLI83467.1 hypothetical protein ANABIO32_11600 [Rossellomorea marisflavi]
MMSERMELPIRRSGITTVSKERYEEGIPDLELERVAISAMGSSHWKSMACCDAKSGKGRGTTS